MRVFVLFTEEPERRALSFLCRLAWTFLGDVYIRQVRAGPGGPLPLT